MRNIELDCLATSDLDTCVAEPRKLVSHMYDKKGRFVDEHHDLNLLRARLMTSKSTLMKLPPSEPAFLQHVKRCRHQTQIWAASLSADPMIESPEGNGWEKHGDIWMPVMYEGPTSSEMLDGLSCKCKGRQKCQNDCSCAKAHLPCTEDCTCNASDSCNNTIAEVLDDDSV